MVNVLARCGKCGEQLSWDDNITDTVRIICQKCGNDVGTYAELKNDASDAIRTRLESLMEDASKRR